MFLPGSINHYRVDSDLQDLDDLELEHLIQQAKGRRDDALWIVPFIAVVSLWVVVVAPVAGLGLVLMRSINASRAAAAAAASNAGTTNTAPPVFTLSSLAGISAVAVVMFMAFAASVFVWLWVRRWLIVRSIRNIQRKASCPYCSFDLRGLRVTENTLVRCPECGEMIFLSDFGLSKRDLALDGGFGAPPAPTSGYIKRDIPPERVLPTETESAASQLKRRLAPKRPSSNDAAAHKS